MFNLKGGSVACCVLSIMVCCCNLTNAEAANMEDIAVEQTASALNISTNKHNAIKNVISLAQVFGDGEKATAAAVEYPAELDASSLSSQDFSVAGKDIIAIYTNDKPENTDRNIPGRYAILKFAQINTVSNEVLQPRPNKGNNGPSGNDAPRISQRKMPDVSIKVMQTGDVAAADGTIYPPTMIAIPSTEQTDVSLNGFKQYIYTDPKTGYTIPYNLFLPANYDAGKSYPLLFFVPDASANSDNVKMALVQGNGATVWAEPFEQAKHECIILAPEYTTHLINSIGMLTTDSNKWTPGLALVSDLLFDVINRYSVDKDRIYGTGQSQGGMANIAISDKYPNLFAAQYLVACQWNVDEMEALKDKNLWIVVCEGDPKAYPGMNAATKRWESLGSKVARSDMWDSKSTPEEFADLVKQTEAQQAKINYTVFSGGNHNYTWSVAYNIEGIRNWLFAQTKSGKPIVSMQNSHRNYLTEATLRTGINYYQGYGVEKNYMAALKYFHLANQRGDFKAARYIGLFYEKGLGVVQDYAEAVKWYQKAADAGDITGTCYLGHMYEAGLGVKRDYQRAMKLYQKSAERGDIIAAPGMVSIGLLYEKGLGVVRDYAEAVKWYHKALAAGYQEAKIDIARIEMMIKN